MQTIELHISNKVDITIDVFNFSGGFQAIPYSAGGKREQ